MTRRTAVRATTLRAVPLLALGALAGLSSGASGQDAISTPAVTQLQGDTFIHDRSTVTDGPYRIMPKTVSGGLMGPGGHADRALVAIGASTPTLAAFDPASPAGRWTFKRP